MTPSDMDYNMNSLLDQDEFQVALPHGAKNRGPVRFGKRHSLIALHVICRTLMTR